VKLEKYVAKLKEVQFKFGIPPIGLLILNQVLEGLKTEDEVTITSIIESSPHASQATTHKYLHALLDKKILAMHGTTDGRKKILMKGKRYEDLDKFIGGCA
jgi:hypothetical protein